MIRLIAYLAFVEALGLIGFIAMAGDQYMADGRYLPLLISLALVCALAMFHARALSIQQVIFVSLMAAAIVILVFSVLSFFFYPGLAKDLELFSFGHLVRVAFLLVALAALHFLLFLFARLRRR